MTHALRTILTVSLHDKADARFPIMLELFCRSPDGIELAGGAHLTPIPIGDAVASLSAILLDNNYYRFIISGRKPVNQLSWIDAEQLIPLKAREWLDLSERKTNGEPIDARDIRKHGNDVLRLSQLLTPESHIESSNGIRNHLAQFLVAIVADESYDPRALQISGSTNESPAESQLPTGWSSRRDEPRRRRESDGRAAGTEDPAPWVPDLTWKMRA